MYSVSSSVLRYDNTLFSCRNLCLFINRISDLEEELDNKEKEHRKEKLQSDERIKMLEKKYVLYQKSVLLTA